MVGKTVVATRRGDVSEGQIIEKRQCAIGEALSGPGGQLSHTYAYSVAIALNNKASRQCNVKILLAIEL